MTNERMIADAKRAARRLARTRVETYQECLDIVARNAGRRNWSEFLADPTDVRGPTTDSATIAGTRTEASMAQTREETNAHWPLTFEIQTPDASANHPKARRTMNPGGGEGIVLGLRDDRLLRSSRCAVVICVGEPGSGKTTGVVLPTLALSPDSSQLVHDDKGELLKATSSIGRRDHSRIVILDPLDDCPDKDVERMAFNALHPAFRNHSEDVWPQARAFANALIRGNGYFEVKARGVLAGIAGYLMLRPDQIPDDGRGVARIASMPAIIDWVRGLVGSGVAAGLTAGLEAALEICSEDIAMRPAIREFTPLVEMDHRELSGVIGTMDKAMLPAKNARVRLHLDPHDADAGAGLAAALSDRTRPTTAFLYSYPAHAAAIRSLHALTIDTIGRWRGTAGPSARSMQFLIDEASKLPSMPWIRETLTDGAPAGTSVLIVTQAATRPYFEITWLGANQDGINADHVVDLSIQGSRNDLALLSELARTHIDRKDVEWRSGMHVLADETGVRRVVTAQLFPPRGQ